ncbi:MAG: DUF559 domain-containing protein [Actinobacteria bacterium]|nr:DUF559 domain-containing protein [Actinomycetota bacterium]
MTDHMLRSRVLSGALVAVRQGVFVRADAWPEDAAGQAILRARAEQAANPEGVMSHQSAALVLGLPAPGFLRWHELPVAITLPAGHSSRTRSTVHHVGPLPGHHVVLDGEGYRTTTAARTAVDLAARLDLPEALVLLDGAARMICAAYVSTPRRRDYTAGAYITAARDLLSEAARTVRASGLHEAVAATLPCRESPAESLSAGHMIRAGIPTPSFQAMVRTAKGTYFPDFLWKKAGLIGECDGAVKYTGPAAVVAEKEREQDLRDNGWRFVRWLPKEVMLEPALVMARIVRALGL